MGSGSVPRPLQRRAECITNCHDRNQERRSLPAVMTKLTKFATGPISKAGGLGLALTGKQKSSLWYATSSHFTLVFPWSLEVILLRSWNLTSLAITLDWKVHRQDSLWRLQTQDALCKHTKWIQMVWKQFELAVCLCRIHIHDPACILATAHGEVLETSWHP